jgi:hypothetical protein
MGLLTTMAGIKAIEDLNKPQRRVKTMRSRGKPIRYRIMDVGRPQHHYLQISIYPTKGKKGGRTTGRLITTKEFKARTRKRRQHRSHRKRY